MRVAQAEEAQEVLVDEVEVEEAVDVAEGGVVADGVALVGIGGRRGCARGRRWQEEQEAGDGLELAPATPLAGEQQVGNGRADKEDGRDESLGEQWPARRRPTSSKSDAGGRLEAGDEAVEGNEQEEAELGLGNDEAGKEKRADGGEHGEAGIEAGAGAPGAAGPQPGEPGEAEHGQRVGQVGGKGVLAEDLVGAGDDPVGQRRLLDVADAVDLRGDQVAGFSHVLRGLGMGGIHVVQQRGRRKARQIARRRRWLRKAARQPVVERACCGRWMVLCHLICHCRLRPAEQG